MKNIFILLICLTISFAFSSCDSENEFTEFNTSTAYINLVTELDSIEFSFAEEVDEVQSYIIKIPVAIAGVPADIDREYKVELIEDESTAATSDWNASSIENLVIKQGAVYDTLRIKLNRTEELKEEVRSLTFRLVSNENFGLGQDDALQIKVKFSDILLPPIWWNSWERYFGTFYKETYFKWKEIYYEGADPNYVYAGWMEASEDINKPMYWNNMPVASFPIQPYYYPSTMVFVTQMKIFFDENEVYGTNPDGSKTRIKIINT
ncbi:hypothetical protein BZG02_07820 [Labilibaculum filiforme]|uniref:DUF4843 domain-containing protein n=1 Tax=Labilibaculum filiforme TaxID=1940526 RepID=A0A2N3I0Q6_9BACT|nr:DUF4843 domain-containing protein [Labilibaculum filiforme]PKQ63909.1 hypothetical protein BZG02_07820 [Labilibaculum filiforme]